MDRAHVIHLMRLAIEMSNELPPNPDRWFGLRMLAKLLSISEEYQNLGGK